MTDSATGTLITAGASLIVAILSVGFAFWSNKKTAANTVELEKLKGTVNSDLEKLRAKLSHGQIVSSTQWNAEFKAYQDIWKGMVAIRTLAMKLVLREDELISLGLPIEYLASPGRVELRKDLVQKFVKTSTGLLLAIQESAPFYPEPIRQAANDTHGATKRLFDCQMRALGQLVAEDDEFAKENMVLLKAISEGVDQVESLIRERLADVEVMVGVRA